MERAKFRALSSVQVGINLFEKQFIHGGIYVHDEICTYIVAKDFEFKTIDKGTLGQFTGLVDCHGVEIFEGDVVRYNDMHWTVIYCIQSKCPSLKLHEHYGMDVKSFCEIDYEVKCGLNEALEVIGNIHQNSEFKC